MSTTKELWIATGYKCFAWHGPEGVNIDALAQHIGKSRSTFYHSFTDFETFEKALFEFHLVQSVAIVDEGKSIHTFFPDYADLLVKYKDWLFFHKHMFLLRHSYQKYDDQFMMAREITESKLLEIWLKTADLETIPKEKIEHFSYIIRETIFIRLNYDSFSADVLKSEVEKINSTFHVLLSTNPK